MCLWLLLHQCVLSLFTQASHGTFALADDSTCNDDLFSHLTTYLKSPPSTALPNFVFPPPCHLRRQTGDYRNGQKGAIVEFFGWPHKAVAQECAFLAKAGYLGAKLFPPQEQVMSTQPFQNVLNPWYFMYQPVSYRLAGRMGTRDELRATIHTCRALGVRVYADAVVNHMTGGGNDANPHHRNGNGGSCTTWPQKNTSAGAAGSSFYTQDFAYEPGTHTGLPPSQEFPAAMYGPTDFHCERALNSWTDPLDLNGRMTERGTNTLAYGRTPVTTTLSHNTTHVLTAGWLTGLVDLNTEKDNVQERIADYLTDLVGIGFSG